MKKALIILLIALAYLYYFTGRYQRVYDNISSRGIIALRDEPVWLQSTFHSTISMLQEKFNNAIEGKKIAPHAQE